MHFSDNAAFLNIWSAEGKTHRPETQPTAVEVEEASTCTAHDRCLALALSHHSHRSLTTKGFEAQQLQ